MVSKIDNFDDPQAKDKRKTSTTLIVNPKRKLRLQKAFYEAGILTALYDALYICTQADIRPPQWVMDGALNVIGDRIKTGSPIGKGQTGNERKKYQAALIHYHRWQAVKQLRRKGIVWTKVYDQAKKKLAGTNAVLGPNGKTIKPGTIRSSYKKVEKDMKDPKKALQYYQCLHEAMELTGLDKGPIGVTIREFSIP